MFYPLVCGRDQQLLAVCTYLSIIYREDWKPVLTINSIIYGLQFLFLEPNPDDPLNKGWCSAHIDLIVMILQCQVCMQAYSHFSNIYKSVP